jgi:GntR family transcriptional regulator
MLRFEEIAADLRRKIESGEYPPGSVIPGGYAGLMKHYGTGQNVMTDALSILEMEGWVKPVRKRGLVVLDRQAPERIDLGHLVYRNELGYFFNRIAAKWAPLAMPTREWAPAPADVAELLGVASDAEVLIRRRILGHAKGEPAYIATSYLPKDVARGTVIEEAHTGPGGFYDRLEEPEFGHGPLSWRADVSTRMPTSSEARDLKISRNVPLLVITRVAESGTVKGKAVEVNQTVYAGNRFKVGFEIKRDRSAKWPVTPADAENPPKT